MQNFKQQGSKVAALAALGLAGCLSGARANTLYVDDVVTTAQKTESYAAMQFESSPTTYNNAISNAGINDVIQFAPGTYTLSALDTTSLGGGYRVLPITKSNVTLKAKYPATTVPASSGNRSIIKGEASQAAGYYAMVRMDNQSNITVDGFEIQSVDTNNSTLDGKVGGIVMVSCTNIKCTRNIIHDCGGGGIQALPTVSGGVVTNACDYLTFDNNEVFNNAWFPRSHGEEGSGISILHSKNTNTTDTGFHNRITNNFVYNNKIVDNHSGVAASDGNGIIVDTNSGNDPDSTSSVPYWPVTGYTDILGHAIPKVLIENNVIYKNGGTGVHLFHAAECTVRNNSTYSNGTDTSFLPHEMDSAGGKNNLFANNISYGNPSRTTLTIFSTAAGGGDASTSTITWHSNTYWNTGGAGTVSMGSAVVTGALHLDPHYMSLPATASTNPPPGNFRLNVATPVSAIDVGSAAANDFATADILTVSRPQHGAYDRGAYERIFTAAIAATPSGGGS